MSVIFLSGFDTKNKQKTRPFQKCIHKGYYKAIITIYLILHTQIIHIELYNYSSHCFNFTE